jgi:MYXO-CTERM domain-containing protein
MRWLAILIIAAASGCIDPVDSTATPADAAGSNDAVKIACDGALCSTSNGSSCNVGGDPTLLAGLVAVAAIVRVRRRGARS